jgi:hypothetical protein
MPTIAQTAPKQERATALNNCSLSGGIELLQEESLPKLARIGSALGARTPRAGLFGREPGVGPPLTTHHRERHLNGR